MIHKLLQSFREQIKWIYEEKLKPFTHFIIAIENKNKYYYPVKKEEAEINFAILHFDKKVTFIQAELGIRGLYNPTIYRYESNQPYLIQDPTNNFPPTFILVIPFSNTNNPSNLNHFSLSFYPKEEGTSPGLSYYIFIHEKETYYYHPLSDKEPHEVSWTDMLAFKGSELMEFNSRFMDELCTKMTFKFNLNWKAEISSPFRIDVRDLNLKINSSRSYFSVLSTIGEIDLPTPKIKTIEVPKIVEKLKKITVIKTELKDAEESIQKFCGETRKKIQELNGIVRQIDEDVLRMEGELIEGFKDMKECMKELESISKKNFDEVQINRITLYLIKGDVKGDRLEDFFKNIGKKVKEDAITDEQAQKMIEIFYRAMQEHLQNKELLKQSLWKQFKTFLKQGVKKVLGELVTDAFVSLVQGLFDKMIEFLEDI